MVNTEETKPEGKKAVLGWLFILLAVGIVVFMVYRWFAGNKDVDRQMEKVRAAKEEKRLNGKEHVSNTA